MLSLKGATVVLAIILIVLVLALLSGSVVGYKLIYVLAIGLVVNLALAFLSLRGLHAEVRGTQNTVDAGTEVQDEVFIQNKTFFPRLHLEVSEETSLPGQQSSTLVNLGSNESRVWPVKLACRRRGLYTLGPTRVAYRDLLGLFEVSRTFGEPRKLLVLPATVNIGGWLLDATELAEHTRAQRRGMYPSPAVGTIRRYEPGDSYNRIHWKSTLHHRELMSKELDIETADAVWLIADLHQEVQAGSGDDSTEEYAVTIAASYAKFYLFTGFAVGLIAYGAELTVITPDRGSGQLGRILEALALAKAAGTTSMEQVLASERKRIGGSAMVVAITPSTSPNWLAVLRYMYSSTDCFGILLDRASFAEQGASPHPEFTAPGSRVRVYLVRKGDDLATVLSTPVLARRTPAMAF